MTSEKEKNTEEKADPADEDNVMKKKKPPLLLPEDTEKSYPINYMTEEDPKARAEALKAREHIEVEETFVPGKPFFTPAVINDFISNPTFIDKFDSFLTMQLLIGVSDILEREGNLVEVGGSATIFAGDIHGDYDALVWILDRYRSYGSDIRHLVFLGDYVDAGKDSLKVVNRLFLEKLADPERIILLRGNNETLPINFHYGFLDEIKEKFLEQHHEKVFNWYNEIFALLPLAVLHGGETLALHGGIPRLLEDIREINSLEANTELSEDDILFEILWNDPVDENVGFEPSPRGDRARLFGRKVFDIFIKNNGLKRMVVAHKAVSKGFEYYFDGRLLRIFSAPDYRGQGNAGAIAVLDHDGEFSIEEISLDPVETMEGDPGQ